MPYQILIIDDDIHLAFGLNAMLKKNGFTTKTAHDGESGIKLAREMEPDIIICDVIMPSMSGFDVIENLRKHENTKDLPFIFLTARAIEKDKLSGLSAGADDYITKPFSPEELLLRVQNILRRKEITVRQTFAQLDETIKSLQKEITLLRSYANVDDDFVDGLVHMLKLRDNETEEHAKRVIQQSEILGTELGFSKEALRDLRWGAALHDIGKVAIPDRILNKAGALTPKERTIMEEHATYGYELLAPLNLPKNVLDIPRYHHEKWDGTGYPEGLAGENIPLSARIFAIVDVWDALTSDRPYRKAWSRDTVLKYIQEQSGKHFDPKIAEIFLKLIQMPVQNLSDF